jgi:hypothetical protein
LLETWHGKDTPEDSLVITIEKTSNTSEHSDAEDSKVFDQRQWATCAHKCLAPLEGDIIHTRTCVDWSHDVKCSEMCSRRFQILRTKLELWFLWQMRMIVGTRGRSKEEIMGKTYLYVLRIMVIV